MKSQDLRTPGPNLIATVHPGQKLPALVCAHKLTSLEISKFQIAFGKALALKKYFELHIPMYHK